jgi:hypothetical protein
VKLPSGADAYTNSAKSTPVSLPTIYESERRRRPPPRRKMLDLSDESDVSSIEIARLPSSRDKTSTAKSHPKVDHQLGLKKARKSATTPKAHKEVHVQEDMESQCSLNDETQPIPKHPIVLEVADTASVKSSNSVQKRNMRLTGTTTNRIERAFTDKTTFCAFDLPLPKKLRK